MTGRKRRGRWFGMCLSRRFKPTARLPPSPRVPSLDQVGLAAFIFWTLMSTAEASTALISCGVMKRNCLSRLSGSRAK